MSDSCSSCRFSATPVKPPEHGVLECRHNPPVVTGRRPLADWPLVPEAAWCGQYEARPVAAKAPRAKRPAVGDTETREQG